MRFATCFLTSLFALGCGGQATNSTATGRVTVEVVREDGADTVGVCEAFQGETVEAVMRGMNLPGVVISGSGTTAFVNQIGDQATKNGEGWTFKIDGERAERGIGTTQLDPPATITWTYGEF